jgi:hypothetical protein
MQSSYGLPGDNEGQIAFVPATPTRRLHTRKGCHPHVTLTCSVALLALHGHDAEEVSMTDIPRHPAFYLALIFGLAVIVGVLAFAMSGGRLPGTVNSPSADVSGKTAQ